MTKPEAVAEWNEWVQRYHPLGYRQPLGTHLRYFLLDGEKRQLGCLLFDFAARNVRCRDQWIGWPVGQHHRHLSLVVRNARFVLFPWVQVKCLASQALGLALRQLPQDWQRRHGYRPVLAETYVDPRQHQGTCYRAANWQCVGQTQARGAMGGVPAKTPKDVYVYPLHADWRRILQQGPPKAAKPRRSPPRAGPRFVQLWQELIGTLVRVAGAHDREWIKRRRTLNTLLVMLFVFRLVFAPRPARLRHGAGRAVGPLPPARGDPAAAAAGLGRGDLPGPRQGGRGDLPQRSPRRPRAAARGRARRAVARPPRLRCRRLQAEPAAPAGPAPATARPATRPTTRKACSAASTSCAPASRSTSTCTPMATSAAPPWPTSPPSPPAMSSSTTAATTPSSCCTPTASAACTRSSACSATPTPSSASSCSATAATRS